MHKLVSIIIVNYNGKKWLKKCFDSLINQTYKNFEIIFVDNGSSDESVEYIEKNYTDKRIKIIESKNNLGFAGGNNLGINIAKGELILLLNNDVWVEKTFLNDYIQSYVEKKVDVVAAREAKYDGMLTPRYTTKIDLLGHPAPVYDKYNKIEPFYLSGVCILFTKKLYLDTKGLDNNFFMYFEETDWFWRLHLLGYNIHQIDNITVYHYGSGSTGAGIKYLCFLWRNQNTLQMLLKNYSLHNLLWVLPIYVMQNIIEIIFFLIILRPEIAFSYIQGWFFNIKNFSRTMQSRQWVQKNRLISDWEIMKKMYFGFGKLNHLVNFYKK